MTRIMIATTGSEIMVCISKAVQENGKPINEFYCNGANSRDT
jgi:hypothetical protein